MKVSLQFGVIRLSVGLLITGLGYNVENLIARERYVMDHMNLKFVRIQNPPVILHALTYPHFMLFVGLTDQPADSRRAADIRLL